jgi:hypothetical protein
MIWFDHSAQYCEGGMFELTLGELTRINITYNRNSSIRPRQYCIMAFIGRELTAIENL